jgi:hypothetical protein
MEMFDDPESSEPAALIGNPRTAKLKTVASRQQSLYDATKAKAKNAATPFLPGLAPQERRATLLERLMENGSTTLDRLHQAMLIFSRSQSALLGTFLERSGVGRQARFWQLAQALSALYPAGSDEKRWVDGVLARKKGLGF